MNGVKNNGLLRLTDDERFALIINYTPAQSISIVDLEKGVFVEEVETPGCSVIYGAGNRDFYSICGNGSFLQIKLDDDGKVVARKRSERFFDAVNDFVSIAASRINDTWYFVSRQYNVYAIKMVDDTIELIDTWSLVSEAEREDQWTIAGMDHTTTHAATNRLYVMMHQGEAHQFEEATNHVWVFDAATGEKLDEIELAEPAGAMKVSQGQEPKLYTMSFHIPIPSLALMWMFIFDGEDSLLEIARQRVSVYDGLTGEHLRDSELIPQGGFVFYTQPW
jgi:methylamine dehydrogenase heavy chain